jgi:hypothetical protein
MLNTTEAKREQARKWIEHRQLVARAGIIEA